MATIKEVQGSDQRIASLNSLGFKGSGLKDLSLILLYHFDCRSKKIKDLVPGLCPGIQLLRLRLKIRGRASMLSFQAEPGNKPADAYDPDNVTK